MVEWFNRHVPAWMDGTEALSHECYRVYDVVLNLIYLNDGPIVPNERGLAGRCNMSARAFRVALSVLISAGKLEVFEGKISNKRARTELEEVANWREKSAKGGRASAERRRKLLENHKSASTTLPTTPPSKEEQEKEYNTAPNGAGHFDDWPEDYREQWWALYPRKVEKKAALSKLAAVRKSHGVTWATMKAGLTRYIAEVAKRGTEAKFIKHPTVWLNKGCWDDEDMFGGGAQGEDWKKVVYGR